MAYARVEFNHPLCLNDLIPALDPTMLLVITDGVSNTIRCLPADVSKNLRCRKIEFIKVDGAQLRIIVQPTN